jgi:hypothetical protein
MVLTALKCNPSKIGNEEFKPKTHSVMDQITNGTSATLT